MKPKYSIKQTAVVVGILALVSIAAVAQENRSEISSATCWRRIE